MLGAAKGGMMDKSTKRLLTLMECETRTGRKVSTWRKAIARREIAFVRLGRSVRIPEEVIEQMIAQGYRPALPEGGERS
jgi:excisionase family DNA binding protein